MVLILVFWTLPTRVLLVVCSYLFAQVDVETGCHIGVRKHHFSRLAITLSSLSHYHRAIHSSNSATFVVGYSSYLRLS
jgi:hypothetical protein